jgi:release factor glutamine methyltransferase
VDVGTGSGCIALALACEGRFDRVVGTDVSLDALNVARANAAHLGRALCAPVEFRHGSLLAPVRASDPPLVARCIVSNPPYIAYAEAAALPPSVRDWEPPLALYAPNEGMAIIAALVREAAELLEPDGLLALEVDARRAALAAELAATDGATPRWRCAWTWPGASASSWRCGADGPAGPAPERGGAPRVG